MKLIYLLLVLLFISCQTNPSPEAQPEAKSAFLNEEISDPYFGDVVDTTVQMFAEGIVSTKYQELNAAYAPDMQSFYYTLADNSRSFYSILYYEKENEIWQGPKVAEFSGTYSDADPFFSPDGKRLYFISRRPIEIDSTLEKDFDIWYVEKSETGWGTPVNVGAPVNTDNDEYYISVTNDYDLVFSSSREGSYGYGDIYMASLNESGGYEINNLGPNVNSDKGEGDPYISPEGDMLIFMSWGREDGAGSGDLYISRKENQEWTKAKMLESGISGPSFEYCPIMSPDGKYFFFTSYRSTPMFDGELKTIESFAERLDSPLNGAGNVYWVDARVLEGY